MRNSRRQKFYNLPIGGKVHLSGIIWGRNFDRFFSLQLNWRKLLPDVFYLFYMLQFNVVPKDSHMWHETWHLGWSMTCWYVTFPWLQNWTKDAMFRDQWKPLVDDGIKPLVNGNEERPGSTFKCFCERSIWGMEISMMFKVIIGNIIKSRIFLRMISKDSVGGKKMKNMSKVGYSFGSMLLFNVNYLCCSTSSTCFDFLRITTSDPECLIAVRQRRTEEWWKIL